MGQRLCFESLRGWTRSGQKEGGGDVFSTGMKRSRRYWAFFWVNNSLGTQRLSGT